MPSKHPLKVGCTGPSESTHVKIPHCSKSHGTAQLLYRFQVNIGYKNDKSQGGYHRMNRNAFIWFGMYKKSLVSSVRVHNNCELPVGIYNICECLVWVGRRCSARCGVDICD